jgi:branched-chain amino acid transport system ATP-binding protein
MFEASALNSGYGKLHILNDVSLTCGTGDLVVVLGPNGSGKTTLLNSIFGFADVFSGSIRFDGKEITRLASNKISRIGIGYTMQIYNIFSALTVEENMKISAASAHVPDPKKNVTEALEIFPRLKNFLDRRAETLSGGERQMLAMSITLVKSPKLMLLDEPTGGLSPLYTSKIIETAAKINQELGVSVILVEQNVRKALEVAKKAYLLVSGRIIFEGTPSELLAKEDLLKLYLGAMRV